MSLWPSAQPVSPPHESIELPAHGSSSIPPIKPPSIAEMTTPLSLPPPTFFEPAATVLLSLPPTLHLSYALFIPLWTLLIRSTTTLPLTLWQRSRTKRFQDKVMPLIRQAQARISFETRDECRRAGKSYEEYQKEFQKRAKAEAKQIAKRHNASPMLTLLVPPLLHLPIFISMTLIIRDACQRASTTLSLTPSSLNNLLTSTSTAEDATTSILTTTALQHLQDLATTSVLWCPSLILPDPTMMLPLAVGIAALANVEVSAKTRKANAKAALEARGQRIADEGSRRGPRVGVVTAAEKRRIVARLARQGESVNPATSKINSQPRRSYAVPTSPLSQSVATRTAPVQDANTMAVIEETDEEPRTTRIITNALRFSAILFIPFAAFAPSAVCVYWFTSNVFTLIQNSIFAYFDRTKDQQQRMQRILKSRVS
ncbi:hypothetical protein OIO90_004596 [Microbotryomycetes sp. JL221]|nr:hypothetical protein OIO90_004596 [Microbotryomycetes sp. JL221]